ncbi:hypothetical protein PR202_ga28442 [Eleusine coracana subsp. coracana]|uniref:SCP domain-containing protein n=1 Tax=Eleusine coracana subsp. coracana TaxID=191504 RepID=A0AAV5DJ40_ELECO|nr:hypothetical protein QOZ80_7AG0554680 [Eleusine coracana subsp. coracana]GJN10354.1 hypothetical protein PR202_ga28442 [Eleusine coracana subsp. coracana]
MVFSSKLVAFLALALAAAVVVEQCAAQNSPQDFLKLHNTARREVGVGPVSWNESAAAYARRYAQYCGFNHAPKPRPYGESYYWGSNGNSASDAVGSWMMEKPFYHHQSNSCSAPAGRTCSRFTQVVWRNSKAIGCARAVCSDDGGVFILCAYSPPGNVAGQKPY